MRRLIHRAATPPSQERVRYNYTKDFRCVVAADDSWFDADFDRVGLHCAGTDGGSYGYISAGGGRITYGHAIAYRCANFVTNGDDCAVNAGADGYQHAGSTDVHAGSYIYAQAAAYGYAAAHSYQHARADAYPAPDQYAEAAESYRKPGKRRLAGTESTSAGGGNRGVALGGRRC